MVDHFRPSCQFFGSPWVDDRHVYSKTGGSAFFVSREMASHVADVEETLFRARTRTRFDPDAFWVDLWITARDRLRDVWWVLRHGMPETEDD